MVLVVSMTPVNLIDYSGYSSTSIIGSTFMIVGVVLLGIAVIASAGTVGALAGMALAYYGATASVAAIGCAAVTYGTYALGGAIIATAMSDAGEVITGSNVIRDSIMGGSSSQYATLKSILYSLGGAALLLSTFAPGRIRGASPSENIGRNTPRQHMPGAYSRNVRDGYQTNYYDYNGNWSSRLDAYSKPGSKDFNPHIHFNHQGSKGIDLYTWWERINQWINTLGGGN